jgi:hypothetical protein
MNITSKIFLLVLFLLGLSLSLAYRAHATAQISLQNNTNFWLNLYIDGNFGCGPVMPSGFCTSSVTPGSHVLEARKRGELSTTIPPETVNIGDGTSPTWTVSYEDPDQALIRKLDGARYLCHRSYHGDQYASEAELDLTISGTTLIWRSRFTWASPEVQMQPSHFVWKEFGRMQINGREASCCKSSSLNSKFTLSEDDNSITENSSEGTFIYSRQ